MDAAALILIGAALLAVFWLCWSGRWRAWSRIAMLPSLPITLLPGLGLCLLLSGAGVAIGGAGEALIGIGLLAALAGLVLVMWEPSWYGPRWFRERDSTYDLSVPINAAIAASVRREPAESSEALARARMGNRDPGDRWRAHLVSDEHGRPSAMQRIGVVRGHLLLYPDALAFAADAGEDRVRGGAVVEIIPGDAIRSVRRVPPGSRPDGDRAGHDLPGRVMPRLRVDTASGAHVFEIRSAGRRAKDLESRYLGRALTAS
jgi:hypothetical protein